MAASERDGFVSIALPHHQDPLSPSVAKQRRVGRLEGPREFTRLTEVMKIDEGGSEKLRAAVSAERDELRRIRLARTRLNTDKICIVDYPTDTILHRHIHEGKLLTLLFVVIICIHRIRPERNHVHCFIRYLVISLTADRIGIILMLILMYASRLAVTALS